MSAAPECDKVLLVQAELDGELDAAEAAMLAAHRATCPICREAAAALTQARGMVGPELRYAMPEAARARIAAKVAEASLRSLALPHMPARRKRAGLADWRRWWSAIGGFGLGAACAAAIALLVVAPRQEGLVDQVVASHIRALQPGHLEDVPSTDQHTVKPWFDGRIDFAPPVKDLAAERFPLQGGRLDYLAGRPVAALIYRHDKHLIDLYVWPTNGAAATQSAEEHGYNLVHWTERGMTFWAVSDVEADQLRDFAADFRRSP
jgi:anti-sigma factor RsiW